MYTKGSRVKFKGSKIPKFLNELSRKSKNSGISIHVTSAYRSPADQARVVCANVVNTDGANLSIYGSQTQNMYRTHCPDDMDVLVRFETSKLRSLIRSNPNYQGHGTGDAVDLRIRNLTNDQKIRLKSMIESMGAKVLWEHHPEHFHVWLRDWKAPIVGFSAILFLGGLSLLYYKRKEIRGWGKRLR